ncbi:MAG: hypothetical protein CL764_03390 [Chloroflexi bacterium]|nr:hypothetical protein [Chloroflexota bacterium]
MKVVYITNARLPTEKAHGIQIIRMCEAFSKLGFDVSIIHPWRYQSDQNHRINIKDFYNLKEQVSISRIPFFDIYLIRKFLPSFLFRIISFKFAIFWGIISLIIAKIKKPNICIMRDNTPFSYWFFQKLGMKTILEFHDLPPKLSLKVFKSAINIHSSIFAVTKSLARDLEKALGLPHEMVNVLHDGVDLETFKLNIKDYERLGVTYCGSLLPDKGIDTLLQASQILSHLRFTIIGGHPSEIDFYKKKWGEFNLENVNFWGFKNPKLIPKYLIMSDLLILPSSAKTKKSYLYTSAMKLFEYLGAGKAIIASDIPSITEVLKHCETAYLVKPDDHKELAKAIEKVLKDNALKILLESNAKKLSMKYSWIERAKEMLEKSNISY